MAKTNRELGAYSAVIYSTTTPPPITELSVVVPNPPCDPELTLVSGPELNYNGSTARKLPALRRRYAAVLGFEVIPEAEGPFPPSIEAARRPLVRHLGGRNSAKMPPPPLFLARGAAN